MSFLKNRTVVGVICILLSLLICFGLTPLFNQSVSQKAEIVRVVQPIQAGDEITESMVQTVEVGGYNLPEDVLRQKESAVGKSMRCQKLILAFSAHRHDLLKQFTDPVFIKICFAKCCQRCKF